MLQPRILASAPTTRLLSLTPSHTTSYLISSLSRLNLTQTRAASHASQGRANKAAPGPGKRLGAKKSDSEPVVPGNIIFRQRGSLWFPGENTVMGRDHTISATAKGFVRYYRDPSVSDKKYIGVVFEQHEKLPRGRNAGRRRRLGMDAVVIQPVYETEGDGLVDDVVRTKTPEGTVDEISTTAPGRKPQLSLRQGFQYRESNWSIGRIAERKGVQVPKYDKNNRWSAWRRRMKKLKKVAEMQKLKKTTKSGKAKAKAKSRQKK